MSLRKIILISTIINILLASCSLSQKSEDEVVSEIYSEVLAYGFSYGSPYGDGSGNFDYCETGALSISPRTEDFRTVVTNWQQAKDYFPELEQETWENFLQVNSQSAPFPSNLHLGCTYELVDVPPNQPMEDCVVVNYFSQIGFNASKNQALVSYGQSCGFYGCSSLYFAELIEGHWVVIDLDEIVCS